jgi:hypothetical protein
MSLALGWLGTARVTKQLMACLGRQIQRQDGSSKVDERLWVRRHSPSADRALEMIREGMAPDASDGAALVRQLQRDEAAELAREIIEQPWTEAMEPLLRDICALFPEAARRVGALAEDGEPAAAQRAMRALEWPDVFWD